MLGLSLVEIGPLILEKMMKMLKVYYDNNTMYKEQTRKNFDEKK